MMKSLKFKMGALLTLLVLALSLHAGSSSNTNSDDLKSLASKFLEANITTLPTGSYLSAGSHQFKSLWTRDFCFAARGLILGGRADVVRDQLSRLVSMIEPKLGILPRYMDNYTVVQRYMFLNFPLFFPRVGQTPAIAEPLVPNYWSGGTSPDPVIDSNALALWTALEYVQATGDQKFWDTNEDDFVRIYRVYDKFLDDGLIKQGRAADWQDSVTRVGKAFFTNLIFWTVTDRLQSNPKFQIPAGYAAQLKQRIIETFKDPESGLYFTMETGSQISLEGLLFAIDWGFDSADSADGKALYASLKKHPLWAGGKSGIPGFATYPNYDESAVEPMPKLSGVRHYHDEIYWSWLIALSAKIAFTMNDPSEGNRILSRLEQLAQRDGAVAEVFWPEANLPKVKTAVYRAEIPFSWGSSITLEALNAQKNFK